MAGLFSGSFFSFINSRRNQTCCHSLTNSLLRKLGQIFVRVHSSVRLFVLTHKDSSKTQNLPGVVGLIRSQLQWHSPTHHAKVLKKNVPTLYSKYPHITSLS